MRHVKQLAIAGWTLAVAATSWQAQSGATLEAR